MNRKKIINTLMIEIVPPTKEIRLLSEFGNFIGTHFPLK